MKRTLVKHLAQCLVYSRCLKTLIEKKGKKIKKNFNCLHILCSLCFTMTETLPPWNLHMCRALYLGHFPRQPPRAISISSFRAQPKCHLLDKELHTLLSAARSTGSGAWQTLSKHLLTKGNKRKKKGTHGPLHSISRF